MATGQLVLDAAGTHVLRQAGLFNFGHVLVKGGGGAANPATLTLTGGDRQSLVQPCSFRERGER